MVIFDESMPIEERARSVISSTSIPFAFEPVIIDDMELVDGSMYSNLSIGDPIERCREEVDNDSDIIIDVVLCYSKPIVLHDWDTDKTRWKTALDYYNRRKEIQNYHRHQSDVLRMMRGFPDVHFRLMIEPESELTSKGAVPIFATKEDM